MLKVWLNQKLSAQDHGSILPIWVSEKPPHSLSKEDVAGCSDLWVSPNESSSLLLAPCLWETQTLAMYPRTFHISLVALPPEKRECVCSLYPSPISCHCLQGKKTLVQVREALAAPYCLRKLDINSRNLAKV